MTPRGNDDDDKRAERLAQAVMLLRDVGPVQTDLADVHGSFPVTSYA